MAARTIRENVFAVGAIDWDRTLFDALIPLPRGTSYNSYIVRGSEKTALIDTVDPSKAEVLIDNIKDFGKIDYVISNHAEQDHSGTLPKIIELHPDIKIVTNEKCKGMLQDMYSFPDERFALVDEGDKLELGGKTLQFFLTPWVHWPETMVSYLVEDKILFTCDFFGSHLATSDLYVEDEQEVYFGAKRYYAEIMMPFRDHIKSHLEKLRKLDLVLIAPSHGPIYGRPDFILSAYEDWASDKVKNQVLVAYVSMHDTTKAMVDYLCDLLMQRHITVRRFNLINFDLGEFAMALIDSATLIIASPTVLVGPHPQAMYASFVASELRPKTRWIGIVGSFGWGGKMVEQLTDSMKGIRAEFLEPVLTRSHDWQHEFAPLESLANQIAERHHHMS